MKWKVVVTLALSALSACGAAPEQAAAPTSDASGNELNTAVRVRVASVALTEIGAQSVATGVVEPFRKAVISAEVGGRVIERLVEPGTPVRSDQIMLRLDDERARITRKEAQARRQTRWVNLSEARNELARGENLREKQFISEDTLETLRFGVQRALSGLREAEASLASAERALADTIIRAPFDGTAELVHAQIGDFLNPSSPVVTLVDFSRARVRAGVTAREAALLGGTRTAEIGLEALGSAAITGEVHSVARVSDPTTGTYAVEIWIDQPGAQIREGMLANVRLPYEAPERSLMMPSVATFRRDGRPHVFIADGNVARLKAVQTGRANGATIEVTAGLSAGDRVIIEGQFALSDGASIAVAGES